MLKLDSQRAGLVRIPEIERNKQKYFRQVFCMCNDYQTFATVQSGQGLLQSDASSYSGATETCLSCLDSRHSPRCGAPLFDSASASHRVKLSSMPKPGAEVPILETQRLRLRRHHLGDFAEMAAMWADPNVTKQIRDQPFTLEESWARLLRYVGHWVLLGFGYWIVEHKLTGKFLGEVGFADSKRDLNPSIEGIPEIGWVLNAESHGKGYGTEAVHAAVAWGDTHLGANKTVCIITPENAASIRVAEKCGYREFQQTTYHGQSAIIFKRSLPRG